MAMKMLEAGGVPVYVDGIRTADDDNPKGYFEYERVKDLAQETDKSWLGGARGKAVKIISYLLKDLPPSFNYQVLFMRRDLSEVLASQNKMLKNRGEEPAAEDARMRDIFEDHLWRASYLLKNSAHFEHAFVDYKAVIDDAAAEAAKINDFLGGHLDTAKMVAAVDESLYRNRR